MTKAALEKYEEISDTDIYQLSKRPHKHVRIENVVIQTRINGVTATRIQVNGKEFTLLRTPKESVAKLIQTVSDMSNEK